MANDTPKELQLFDGGTMSAKEPTDIQDREHCPEELAVLAASLQARYERSAEPKDLEEAIKVARRVVQLTPYDHSELLDYLCNLESLLEIRFEESGKAEDLEEAIGVARRVVQSTPSDHPDWLMSLYNLGTWLRKGFERSGEMEDLEEAIRIARRAIQSIPSDHPDLVVWLNELALSLGVRFDHIGATEDLEESITKAQQAVQSSPADHPQLFICLNTLTTSIGRRFEQSGRMEDLEEAIDTARRTAQLAPSDHPILFMCLNNLGVLLGRQFERSGDMEIIEEAIDIVRRAVQLISSNDPSLSMLLNNLGLWLERRFERSGETRDYEEAIELARQAVTLAPSSHPDLPMWLSNLGLSLGRRFERSGETKDLEEAIDTTRRAVRSTPSCHPNLLAYLNNLGIWLGRRFERSGEIEDREEAIDIAQRAVHLTPSGHPNLPLCLGNLGLLLGRRFEWSGEAKDLEEAINITQRAVQLFPSGHPNLLIALDHLATWLISRFERNEEIRDLKEATDAARKVVQLTPPRHPDLSRYLHNLGNDLGCYFEHTGEEKCLEEAIDMARRAVMSTPADHPNLPLISNSLGQWLEDRFKQNGDMKDLEEAIDLARHAVRSTPSDHPDLPMCLNNLGRYLWTRFERIGDTMDREETIHCYSKSFDCTTAIPLKRVEGAARCISKLAHLNDACAAVKLGQDALALLPIVNNRNLTRSDQQFALHGFAGIASDLCAVLILESRVHAAVECLEQGRAIIISRLLDDRSDVSELAQKHPELAQRYQSLVAEVNTPFNDSEDKSTTTARVVRRREAVTELEACLQDIRSSPGQDRFIIGQTVAQMQEDMGDGCIVFVNVSSIRSDAIVMTQGTLQGLHLPDLRVEDAKRWLRTNWKSNNSGLRQKNNEFLEYLTWLWHVCVKHVLEHVSTLYKEQYQTLPRVWWIGCGLASSMPFHAAGIHVNASQENALSKVVSSYTPSVKALNYSRSQIRHTQTYQPAQDQMLVTLMPETPRGANDKTRFKGLKGITVEAQKIAEIASPHVSPVVCIRPNADEILGQLEHCQIAHFACHGMSHPKDPSSSGLVLQRLAPDGRLEQDYLTVYRISQSQLKHAKIAYLSACSTAENKDARLRDEVIHIVSGFQVAGFPHVVGSLWPAGDKECVKVASGFYSKLFENGSVSDVEGRRVACALQEAVMAVRAQDVDMPLNWAQFVHFGA